MLLWLLLCAQVRYLARMQRTRMLYAVGSKVEVEGESQDLGNVKGARTCSSGKSAFALAHLVSDIPPETSVCRIVT